MIYSCVDRAIEAYSERIEIDTNQAIVQMIDPFSDELIDHWYYRSDQFIFQPYNLPFLNINSYIGSPNKAPLETYGNGTFMLDLEITNEAKNSAESIRGCSVD